MSDNKNIQVTVDKEGLLANLSRYLFVGYIVSVFAVAFDLLKNLVRPSFSWFNPFTWEAAMPLQQNGLQLNILRGIFMLPLLTFSLHKLFPEVVKDVFSAIGEFFGVKVRQTEIPPLSISELSSSASPDLSSAAASSPSAVLSSGGPAAAASSSSSAASSSSIADDSEHRQAMAPT